MPQIPKLSLAYLIPIFISSLYLVLVCGEYFYEHSDLQNELAKAKSEQIQKELFRMRSVIESAMESQDLSRIDQEVSLISTDLSMMVYVILDSSSEIRFANHIIWRESSAKNVLEGYSPEIHQSVVIQNKPFININFERLAIQTYYPVSTSNRFSYTGVVDVIYLEYDISNLVADASERLFKRFTNIWSIGALVLMLFCLGLYFLLIKPLKSLSNAAKNIDSATFSGDVVCISKEVYDLRDYLEQVNGRFSRNKKRLNDAEQRWLFAVEGSRNGIWDWNINTGDVFVSDRWKEILGYLPYELDNDYSVWESRLHRDEKAQVLNTLQNYINQQNEDYESVHRLRHKNGNFIWVLDKGRIVEWNESGKPTRLIGTITDVSSDVKDHRISVEKQGHGGITDLINRDLLADELYDLQVHSRKTGLFSAFLIINLDNFKLINDALGKQLGDRLLMQVAARLSGAFSASGLVARLGADEFVILGRNFGKDFEQANKRALALASEVRQLIGRSFLVSDQSLSLSARIGLVVFDGIESFEPQTLLSQADGALAMARKSHSNGCVIYHSQYDQNQVQPFKLQHELKLAINSNQLSLAYQPVVDNAGKVVSVEVLMRWYHPQHGYISPRKFIPSAEISDCIFDMEIWGLEQLCLFINTLKSQKFNIPVMSLNISSRHFHQEYFVSVVKSRLSSSDISPKLIQLELSEDIFTVNIASAKAKIVELQALGIQIAIDDFGSGACALHQLDGLSLSQVKLSDEYLAATELSPAAIVTLTALIELASKLNFPVAAKHIETKEQFNLLKKTKCSWFQGYIISRPLNAADMTQLIKTQLSLNVVT